MTKRERQLLSCLATCLSVTGDEEAAFSAVLGALGRLLGTTLLTFGLQEVATRRILFSARAESEPDPGDGEMSYLTLPSDTGALRSLFRVVPIDAQHRVLLGGMAEVPDDPYTRTAIAEIVPRLAARAFALRRRRDDPERSLAERAFEALPLPLLLVRTDGSIACESRAASSAMGEGLPLRRVDGALRVAEPHLDRELKGLLAATGGDPASPSVLAIPRDGIRPLSLMVWRLAAAGRTRDEEAAHSLVLVCDPQRRPGGVRELLIRNYGLTGSEARVALAVLDGKSVDQLSGELYISLNTAKTHLKSIFAKVGTSRQSELVAAILSGPVGLLR
jgi:DNA-binding CsgD family transcriptional regulator